MNSRSKIFLIKGQYNIAQEITLAECARINVDNIVLITALKYPQFLSESMTPSEILESIIRVVEDFDIDDQRHRIVAEYASMFVDRGYNIVKAVEGTAMRVEWFYNTIKAYHKNCGQSVVDISRTNGNQMKIDGVCHDWESGLAMLEERSWSLG